MGHWLTSEQAWAGLILLLVACLVGVAIMIIVGCWKDQFHFRKTTATHLVWSPLVVWYVLLSYRVGCVVFSVILWILSITVRAFPCRGPLPPQCVLT